MMNSISTVNPAFGDDDPSVAQLHHVLINVLSWGGIALVPSDCGYAVAALPRHRDAIAALDALLDHAKDPIPLSFGSYSMVTNYVDLNLVQRRVLTELWPGQFTLVADAHREGKKILQPLHHERGDKTLGVRVTKSLIEQRLSSEANSPLTTAAIRDDNGQLVRTYDEAVDIVLSHLHRLDHAGTPIVGIRRKRKIDDRPHSTVAQINGTVKILRVGAVPESAVRPLMCRPGSTDWGDAT